LHSQANYKGKVCRWIQVVVPQPASFPFEKQNTKLPDVISLSPYFEKSSFIGFGKHYKRIVTTPLVHCLILRPLGWLDFKTTLILDTAMI
jgi:hypothetical protein